MMGKRSPLQAPDERTGFEDDEGAAEPARRSLSDLCWLLGKALVGVSLVLGSAALVAYGARQFATTSDRFAVHNFVAVGAETFTADRLASMAHLRRGDNLFALDELKAQAALLESPWIASAKVSRKLPDTVVFEVDEHRAVALAAIGDALYLVTRDGHPIERLGESAADFPVITGVSLDELASDRPRALKRVAEGVEVLRQYERCPLSKVYAAQEVFLDPTGAVALVVGTQGTTLQLGKGPIKQKLLMAARVLSRVRARGELPSLVFLDNEAHPERVVVRLR